MGVYTTINDGSAHFTTTLYTGNGQDNRAITNSANAGNFQPDWLWYKERSSNSNPRSFNSSTGASERLEPNDTTAMTTDTSNVKSFNTNGFTVGTSGSTNANGDTYAAWQWKANGGNKTSFSASGSQLAGTYQANTTAGFSLVTYTGNGSSDSTIPHGLGVMPEYVVVKNTGDVDEWVSNGSVLGDYCRLHPNGGSSKACGQGSHDYIKYPGTDATNLLTGVSHNRSNANGDSYIAWCFASKQGYSKLGTYTGNGNADGSFVYTGFKPAFLLRKRLDTAGDWIVTDSTRDLTNVSDKNLYRNLNYAEYSGAETKYDILSNGFKMRGNWASTNASGGSYFYMAFASNPFVTSDGVPTTAR
jgi:hypothetical protein